MANNVIGLFDNESVANQVVDDLVSSGFSRSVINRFEGDNSDLEGELQREGIPADEARYYVDGLRNGGALVSVRAEESETDTAVEIMNRYANTEGSADTSYETDASYAAAGAAVDTDVDTRSTEQATTRRSDVGDEARLDVVEERLNIGKRAVDRGGVRVRRVVTERPVEEQVTLRDETINVDRHTVDRRVEGTADDLFTEQTYEFTETDEEAVVAKETRVVEEVVVDKDVQERTETVRDTVRRADVEIEQIGTRYGESMASNQRYEGREWSDIEADARSDFEAQNSDTAWDDAKDSVRSSWERTRSR